MAMDVGNKKGPRGEINVTPLIDVVLVLLIIFMVLTPSMLKHLTATVPQKADDANTPAQNDAVIVVEWRENHELTLNNEPIAPEALAGKLAERIRQSPQKAVFFKADDGTPYGDVVRLLDIARGAGAQILAVITQ